MAELQIPELKDKLIDVMREELITQRWSLLKSGQRGGKNFIAEQIIERAGYAYIVVCSNSTNMSRMYIESMKAQFPDVEFSVNRIPMHWPDNATIFVVMDEAMWTANSYDTFMDFKENPMCRILVISSRGPEYDTDVRWALLPGHSFSTWDLNPNIKFEELLQDLNTTGAKPFFRDFCAY